MKVFTGVPQSKLAAFAMLSAVLVVGGVLLFSKNKVPFGERLVIIALMVLFSLPSILLSLFQMTCLVTGAGAQNQRWWCAVFSWFLSLMIVLYSALIIVVVLMSLVSKSKIEKFANASPEEKKIEKFKDAAKEGKEGFAVAKNAGPIGPEEFSDVMKAAEKYAKESFEGKKPTEGFEGGDAAAPISLDMLKKKIADATQAVVAPPTAPAPPAAPVAPAMPVPSMPTMPSAAGPKKEVPMPSTPETFTSSGAALF
jgi:hypothetical protein